MKTKRKHVFNSLFLILVFHLVNIVKVCSSLEEKINLNPYEILNVKKNASFDEIKASYRKLSKKWHPDINKSPVAVEYQIKLNIAFQILKDPTKRAEYDSNLNKDKNIASNLEDYVISINEFKELISPKSVKTPVVFFYYYAKSKKEIIKDQNWIIWNQLKTSLNEYDFLTFDLNGTKNNELDSFLKFKESNNLIQVILNKKIFNYTMKISIEQNNKIFEDYLNFFTQIFPKSLIEKIDNTSYLQYIFENTIEKNRVIALIITKKVTIPIRYKTCCYQMFKHIKCITIDKKNDNNHGDLVNHLNNKFNISLENYNLIEGVFIFKDDKKYSNSILLVDRKTSNKLEYDEIKSIMDSNKYLNFPRITSFEHLKDLCFNSKNKKICVILSLHSQIEQKSKYQIFDKFKELLDPNEINVNENIVFTYLFYDKQFNFLKSIVSTIGIHVDGSSSEQLDFFQEKIIILKFQNESINKFKIVGYQYLNQNYDKLRFKSSFLETIRDEFSLINVKENLREGNNYNLTLKMNMFNNEWYSELNNCFNTINNKLIDKIDVKNSENIDVIMTEKVENSIPSSEKDINIVISPKNIENDVITSRKDTNIETIDENKKNGVLISQKEICIFPIFNENKFFVSENLIENTQITINPLYVIIFISINMIILIKKRIFFAKKISSSVQTYSEIYYSKANENFKLFNLKVNVDLIDMRKLKDGKYRWILVYQDYFTRYLLLRPIKTKSAKEVSKTLIDIFSIFGFPTILMSKTGKKFRNKIVEALLKLWPDENIKIKQSHARQPQGSSEKIDDYVLKILTSWMIEKKSTKWSIGLKCIQLRINNPHRTK